MGLRGGVNIKGQGIFVLCNGDEGRGCKYILEAGTGAGGWARAEGEGWVWRIASMLRSTSVKGILCISTGFFLVTRSSLLEDHSLLGCLVMSGPVSVNAMAVIKSAS